MEKIGYSLNAIDDDEWSWSVERLKPGERIWGTGSVIVADGCEYSKAEAVACIKAALRDLGVEISAAVRLPF